MIPLSVGQIAEITGAERDPRPTRPRWSPARWSSTHAQAEPGSLFAALPGERADGHDFAPQAVAAGATAVLASRPPGVPALIVPDVPAALATLARAVLDRLPGLTVAAITGSAGKTTTKDLAAQLIERLGPTVSPQELVQQRDRPPADRAAGRPRETRYLVAGDVRARPRAHRPRCARSRRRARRGAVRRARARRRCSAASTTWPRAKGELPAALPADGVALLNADDPRVLAMAGRTRGPGGDLRPVGRRRTSAPTDVTLDEAGRAALHAWSPGRGRPRSGCGCTASTT